MLVAPSSPPPQPANNSPIAMPNVIVHPPEEEDTPAWCLYDAAQPGDSYHQHAHYNHHHQYHHNAPPYSYSTDDASPEYSQEHFNEMYQPTASVVMIQSGSPHGHTHDRQRSFVDLLENNDGGEPYDSDSEYGDHGDDDAETLEDPYHQQAQQQRSSRMRDAANDSDVIEVVKVRRRSKNMDEQQQQQTMPLQRAATLKSRASKVFRSLLRSKPSKTPVPDVPPLPAAAAASSARPSSRNSTRRARERQEINSNNNNDGPNPSTLSRSNTPTMSRKGSRVLSQLFSAPSIKPRQSISSFDQPEPPSPTQTSSAQNPEPTPVPTPIASPPVVASCPSYSSSLRSSVYHESQPPPRESRSTHRESLYEPSDALDQARLNASSPTPTTASTASKATRRFSKLNLARLFTFSGSSSSSSGATLNSNSNSTPAVEEDASVVAFASSSPSHSPLSPVEPPAVARLSKESNYEQEAIDSGRTTPTSRTASHTSPSAASSVSTSTETAKTEATSISGSGSSSASDSTSGPQTPITSEPDLGIVKLVNPPSSITSSPPSIYSVDSYGSRENEPVVPMHNFDSLFETDKSLSLNLGLGIDLGGGSGESNSIGKGKPSEGTSSKRRISSAGTFGSFITGKRGSRVFSAPGGMMRGHSKQSMDKMQEEEKEDELEMKLDSLHFDDLSFDADRFRAEL
ncbi:hypothetical protein BJ165DRAFT_1532866 [Panaeolus papilionaceus]|nr:hypothetical protein BJ165DRAFT_1532866 [Panaeolus papilionaceus]